MHTAPLDDREGGTLLQLVLQEFPDVRSAPGIKPLEPGLVHRLDRETSGLVVIARTAEAFERLRMAFASGGARKWYRAACADSQTEPGRDQLRIESRFAPYGPGRRRVRPVLAGERSRKLLESASHETYVTEARVIARAERRVLLRVSLLKGFRHQVRVHLAFLGFPILGDPLYGEPVPDGIPARMYLHAERIEMRHPESGEPLIVESPPPEEFDAVVPVKEGERA
jgi:23S rRNA pseudouridine1911/1915/1917 synthase